MTIRWITALLGTAAAAEVPNDMDLNIIDVRDLVDKAGNNSDVVRKKIEAGVLSLRSGRRTVVCCDYGMSRSNAVAAGILARTDDLQFDAAVRRVQEATGEFQIKLEPLAAVRSALDNRFHDMHRSAQRCVLLTGAAGLVGSVLAAALAPEFKVVSPSRKQLDISLGSTQLDLLVGEEGVDCIVHLANPRIYTSNLALGQSLCMLRNVIDVCLARGVHLIYPSCWEVYAGHEGQLLANENTPFFPRGPLGEAKFLAETLIEHCRKTAGLQCALLRSSTLYGSEGTKPKFIYNFIDKARRSMPITTHRYKNANPALDLLYVDDFVSALMASIRCKFTGTLNIGTGVLTPTLEIARLVVTVLRSTSPIDQSPVDAVTGLVALDATRARTELNWSPAVSLDQGLQRVVFK